MTKFSKDRFLKLINEQRNSSVTEDLEASEQGDVKLDEHCGCEESHSDEHNECPLCGSVLMAGECEHHGHMGDQAMELEAVYEVRTMQRLAGILKEDVEVKEEELSEQNTLGLVPMVPGGPSEDEEGNMSECGMEASNDFAADAGWDD